MRGPAAPRDPEKQRAYFYIMRGKEICGLKQGKGSIWIKTAGWKRGTVFI